MEFITLVLLGITLLTVLLIVPNTKQRRLAKYLDKLPGPPNYPIIGCTKDLIGIKRKDLFEVLKNRNKQYGPIYRAWIGSVPIVHLMKAQHVEEILKSNTLIIKSEIYDNYKPWLGDGLLMSSGPKWHRNRKLITPTFHFKILEYFLEVFNVKAKIMVQDLKIKADGETQFDMEYQITHCTLDIFCETAMGIQLHTLGDRSKDYVKALCEANDLGMKRMLSPFFKWDFIYYSSKEGKQFLKAVNILHAFTNKVIEDRKKYRPTKLIPSEANLEVGKKERLAFLDLLMQGGVMTDDEIRQEVDVFMFGGHDTTTVAIIWTLLILGNHTEIQDSVREEINSAFRDDKLSTADLKKLKLLERVIKESLRLFPSAPSIARLLSEDITIDNYFLPIGTTVLMHVHEVHRDAEHFPNPLKFDPDRHLPQNTKNRHPYSFIPFSAGIRNCVGQKFAMNEMKVLLSYIIKNYKVKSMERYDTVKVFKDLTLRPQNGLQVILETI